MALEGLEDEVAIAAAPERILDCPGAPAGPANLAWRAVDALEAACARPLPARIEITKRIPMQAGLGGGSSDAGAVLVGINALYGLGLGTDALEGLAATVGADVPFFIRGGTQWATGRGERLTPQPPPADLWAVICGPVASLSTTEVYRTFDRLGGAGAIDPEPPAGALGDRRLGRQRPVAGRADARPGVGCRGVRVGAPGRPRDPVVRQRRRHRRIVDPPRCRADRR